MRSTLRDPEATAEVGHSSLFSSHPLSSLLTLSFSTSLLFSSLLRRVRSDDGGRCAATPLKPVSRRDYEWAEEGWNEKDTHLAPITFTVW